MWSQFAATLRRWTELI